jgi:hypothetical protein
MNKSPNKKKHLFKKIFKIVVFISIGLNVFIFPFKLNAQTNSVLLDSLLKLLPKKQQEVIKNKQVHRLQIILTQINRDEKNNPNFKHHFYNYDSSNYFNPASTVKLPCSIFALEKINELKQYGINKESIFCTDSSATCIKKIEIDSSSENLKPSIENYIKRMLLVSDNFSYSRVFDFLGIDYIHNKLFGFGHKNARIKIRFDALCKNEESTVSKPFYFTNHSGKKLLIQPELKSTKKYPYPFGKALIGKSHINSNGKKINTPYDFTEKNFLPLFDLHKMMLRLIFHEHLNVKDRYNIKQDDWIFLMKYLSAYPRESQFPKYNEKDFVDGYKKYFILGGKQKQMTDSTIKIYNIVGQSYGFLTDCAYIVDFKTKTEFLISTTIYVNERNIINSGRYEYDSIGFPFLKELGNLILNYEQKRVKKNLPHLTYLPRM